MFLERRCCIARRERLVSSRRDEHHPGDERTREPGQLFTGSWHTKAADHKRSAQSSHTRVGALRISGEVNPVQPSAARAVGSTDKPQQPPRTGPKPSAPSRHPPVQYL